MKTRLSTIWIMFVTSMMVLSGLFIIVPTEDFEVAAKEANTADDAGYSWIDSRDPDPKVEHEWIDATGGTAMKTNFKYPYTYYDCYFYQSTPFQSLPFSFPFYENTYDEILIWPCGVLSFQDTSNGYLYYASTSGGAWPNTYYDYYSPANAIAPWFRYYGAVQMSGTRSEVYVTTGVTDEGVNYWVCSWENVQFYYPYNYGTGYYQIYSGDNEVTYQAVLYENGDIKFNFKDVIGTTVYMYYGGGTSTTSTSTPASCSQGGQYGLTGIQNMNRDIGLTYGYNSRYLENDMSVLIKQFKTEVDAPRFSKGYGPDEDIYPAMAGQGDKDYFARVTTYSEKGVTSLTTLEMIIGPGATEEQVMLTYDFETDTFRKLNDPKRLVVFNEDMSMADVNISDPNNKMEVEFHFDFNFEWARQDHVDVLFKLYGTGLKSSELLVESPFRVVSKVKLVGNLTVYDTKGKELIKGDWVKGNSYIHFAGLQRKYADDNIDDITPPDMLSVAIVDKTGKTYTSTVTSDLDIYVYVDAIYSEMEYRLEFVNVSSSMDDSDSQIKIFYTNGFLVQIDSDNPGLPGGLQILADDVNGQPTTFDDDRDVYVKWDDALDQSSGVGSYHISPNVPQSMATETIEVPKGTNVWPITGLEKGLNRIYIWAEDEVGNVGNEIFVEVKIDLDGVTFAGFYPTTGVWNNNIRPTCSIFVNDTLTGVDPFTIQYEISTRGEIGLENNWQNVQDTYAAGNYLRVVVSGWFKNGKDNWIRFQAQDIAGNGPLISDAYNVWVDAESPKYTAKFSEEEFNYNTYNEIRVQIDDTESGVDASTIEYRVTTAGLTKWTPWKSYKDAEDSTRVTVTIKENFRRGDANYIQVRARDLAGNPISTSPAYNVKVNTFPEIVIVSPSSGDLIHEDDKIVFDATPTFDMDGDKVTIKWFYSDGDDQFSLGDAARVVKDGMEPGEYTITVVVRDRVDNEVMEHFTIVVNKVEKIFETNVDTDLDGMLDWYEYKWQLNPLVKDANEDPDGDGFTNFEEFGNGRWLGQNLTNPKDPRSHPARLVEDEVQEEEGPFTGNMWALWAILAILIVAVIATMFVTNRKKEKEVKRIKTVRNMRTIMPSVSWDQITTTAYMAPYAQGAALPAAAGPALPSAAPVDEKSALPPAQEGAMEQPQQTEEVPQPQPVTPQPAPAPTNPEPAPQPQFDQPPQ